MKHPYGAWVCIERKKNLPSDNGLQLLSPVNPESHQERFVCNLVTQAAGPGAVAQDNAGTTPRDN